MLLFKSSTLSLNKRCINFVFSSQTRIISSNLSETAPRPYEEIPTPPGGWVPFLGHVGLLSKKPHGIKRSWKNVAELREKYVTPGVDLLRLNIPVLNPDGGGRVLQIFDPAIAQEVYRNEGKYPNRGNVFTAFKLLREGRKDLFAETTGILIEDGERWQQLRSKVQQDMMRPKSAMFYLSKLEDVSQELVDYIRRERSPDLNVISNFLPLAHRFGFESITVIALDSHLGCFEKNLSPDLKRNMEAVDVIVKKFPDLLLGFPWWNYFPKRWSPLFRLVEDNFNIVADFVKGKIDEAVKRLKDNSKSDVDDNDMSVLEKLIVRNGQDSAITYVMAFDMVIAGIDTTGNTFAFLLYQLSRNPDKQEKLRQEILSFKKDHLTAQDIGQMRYFRACLQESFRMIPTAANMIRILPNDTVIRGFNIPKGTMVTWYTGILGNDRNLFPDPEKYIPERWIENKDEIHPFSVRNFSHGPRMCIGKRFAELEIQIGLCKLIQNFRIEWAANYDLNPVTELVNVPDQPLMFRFVDIKK